MSIESRPADQSAPSVPLSKIEHLWFQVAGTICNLECHHCFISCSPKNKSFGFMSHAEIQRRLEESASLNVAEFYLTGGEPFMNPEIVPILSSTLEYGPTTVLTNGTIFKDEWLSALAVAVKKTGNPLEFRVSLDGFSAETNDPIRGEGTFQRVLDGISKLIQFEFQPIITTSRSWPASDEASVVSSMIQLLQQVGYKTPRLKILPMLQMGSEESRTEGYTTCQRVTEELWQGYDASQLLCEHSRTVSERGIHVCPILLDAPDSLMGQTFEDASRPFELSHGACFTCFQNGAICSNSTIDPTAPET